MYSNYVQHFNTILPSVTNRDRIAIICYIPKRITHVHHFLAMLYGSWRFINDHSQELVKQNSSKLQHDVDLLAFCHPKVCPEIKEACKKYNQSEIESAPTCWAVEQPFESDVPYGPINSFIMFNRSDIYSILKPYIYILRTDYDVFLTPAMLTWKPKKQIIYGRGGYCDPFNMKRLKEIARKLGMTHRNVHCVGSTWYGDTKLFIEASKKPLEMTAHMYLNEFDPNATGLETIDFKKNRDGEWIRWWRPVSSMYGGELALNDLIKYFSKQYQGELYTSSCSDTSIWESPHIHCWHNNCEFQKFKFINYLNVAINARDKLDGEIVHRILENIYPRDVSNMTVRQYSTFIAWNSVGKHLRKWFV